jgi:hypothetical protein
LNASSSIDHGSIINSSAFDLLTSPTVESAVVNGPKREANAN